MIIDKIYEAFKTVNTKTKWIQKSIHEIISYIFMSRTYAYNVWEMTSTAEIKKNTYPSWVRERKKLIEHFDECMRVSEMMFLLQ